MARDNPFRPKTPEISDRGVSSDSGQRPQTGNAEPVASPAANEPVLYVPLEHPFRKQIAQVWGCCYWGWIRWGFQQPPKRTLIPGFFCVIVKPIAGITQKMRDDVAWNDGWPSNDGAWAVFMLTHSHVAPARDEMKNRITKWPLHIAKDRDSAMEWTRRQFESQEGPWTPL